MLMKHEKAQRPRFTVLVTLLLAGFVLASYGQLEEIVCGEKFLGTARQSTIRDPACILTAPGT